MTHHWSTYQQAIFRHIADGSRHLVNQAYAGCAKTTTAVEGTRLVSGRHAGEDVPTLVGRILNAAHQLRRDYYTVAARCAEYEQGK